MSDTHPNVSARKIMTAVAINTDDLIPLTLRYPNGLLMRVHPDLLGLVQRAAVQSKTPVIILCGTPLQVYYATYSKDAPAVSGVPSAEPLKFFACFQKLQLEASETLRRRSERSDTWTG